MKKPAVGSSHVRWWDLISALLLMAAFFTSIARLVATRWTENLGLIHTIVFFGVIAGLALGQSIFSRHIVAFFTTAYGLFIIPWQLGLTFGAGIDWNERLKSLAGRLEVIVGSLLDREPITDNLLFILLMSCLFWLLSVQAGYTVTRYAHPWRVVLPAGLATFVIHSFDPLLSSRSWYLAFYLFFALLLVARLVFLKNRYEWRQRRTHIPLDVGFDISRFAVLVAMALVFLAWNIPVLADSLQPATQVWQAVNRPWLALKDRFSFAFASLRASVGLVADFYGDNLVLGRGSLLSDSVVLEVEAPNFPFGGARYYWRGRVYSKYQEGQWLSTITNKQPVTPNSLELNQPGIGSRMTASFVFHPYEAISMLYVVPQPVWVSRPAVAYIEDNPDGSVDLSSLEAQEYVRPGERYQVRSSLSSVTIAEMRAAGIEYPQWVTAQYLQLPDDISPRTRELAQRIAAGLDNPYDIADQVTAYLRDNIQYSASLPEPPPGQERIDWFLFDQRQGFCNYYASAEVILLRSLGIPARMAVGFAQGERVVPIIEVTTPGVEEGPPPDINLEEIVTYVVRQRDAHAWPEVFFPGIGWVEFEPTASQDPLLRPMGEDLTNPANDTSGGEQDPQDPINRSQDDLLAGLEEPNSPQGTVSFWTATTFLKMGLLVIILGLLIILIWNIRRGLEILPIFEGLSVQIPVHLERGLIRLGIRPPAFIRYWAYYTSLPSLSRSYMEINRALSRLGKIPALQDTPAERVDMLTKTLPPAEDPARSILSEYQTATYSLKQGDESMTRQAGKDIRKLSYLAKFRRWLEPFQEPPN